MKKGLITLLALVSLTSMAYADIVRPEVYCYNKKFGLKLENTEITKPEYSKIIKLGDNAWIIQYKHKYGIMNHKGEYIIKPKYRWADRVAQNLVKLGNDNDYGVYDDKGNIIIPPEYSLIERISKDFFITCKNYKYGLIDLFGNIVLRNDFDTIFIPNEGTLVLQYQGEWYKLSIVKEDGINFEVKPSEEEDGNSLGEIMVKTSAVSGYTVLTFTDYVLKLFSSLSPAYEATIDELMFAKGGDAVSVIMNFTWLPKLPFTYLKNYYKSIRRQDSDVLSQPRNYLRKKI